MKNIGFNVKQTIVAVWLAVVAITLAASCSKFADDFDFDKIAKPAWNPAYAIPLVNSSIGVADFFKEDGNFQIISNPDQTVSFVYSADSLFSATASEFITFPDQEFQFPLAFYLPPIPPDIYDTVTLQRSFAFTPAIAGQIIDSLFFSQGNLDLTIRTNLNRDKAKMILVSKGIRDAFTNQPFRWETSLDNPGQLAWVEADTSIDLADYKLVMNSAGDTATNLIKFEVTMIVRGDNQPNLSPYALSVDGAIDAMKFSKLFGYIGQYELPLIDSLRITLFDKVISGNINIGEGAVKLNFEIDNSFGVPVTFDADELYIRSAPDPAQTLDVYLFGEGVPNVFGITSPDFTQIGQSVHTSLDFSQGNLNEAFGFMAGALFYNLKANLNADTSTSGDNFLLTDSRIRLDARLEYQLFGALDKVTVLDTIALNLNSNTDDLDYLLFRINLTNGFPLAAGVQVYFADADYRVLDSLITDGSSYQIAGAAVAGAPGYQVTSPVLQSTDITVKNAALQHITASEFMIMKTNLSTTNVQLVKIYSDYNLLLKIGVIAGLNITKNKN
ncbi:MAG: hypothetical protein GX103_12525 [Bacteroidales bacterium]|nr:hypothetical protein [Bacteroidales bacterium]